ncbi:MAG: Ig-like domain-containing protein [Rubripirellula sp.]|nr:Ig-like domain-containing protein [Rubripirellula sp.]
MIKRNQAKQTRSDKKRSARVSKRRRLNMEGLEERRLLAVMTGLPSSPAPDLPEYTLNRNVGTVQAYTYNESESFLESGLNDSISNADVVPIGTGFGQQDTVDVYGFFPQRGDNTQTGFSADLDTFEMNMRGGDILDVAVQGAATQFIIRDVEGQLVFGSSGTLFSDATFAINTPRQTVGNATGTFVIPREGSYYLTVAADIPNSNYTIGLRAYRPVTEQLEVGDAQIVYLDFNGDVIDGNLVGLPGFVRLPGLVESLPLLGLEPGNIAAANNIMEKVIDGTVRIFEDLTQTGENGDYTESSVPGEYAVRILNSRDHAGQISMNDPRLTRMMIGGSGTDINRDDAYGYAQSVDLGNFDLSQYGFFALDLFGADAQDAIDGGISPNNSQVDFIGDFLAAVVAHEAGHTLGMAHTDGDNFTVTVSDEGGSANSISYMQSLGPDGIYGTSDDVLPVFADDFYSLAEGFIGKNEITNTLAQLLSTGTKGGGSVSGRVFLDANLDGSSIGDGGLLGATVFADVNGDGVHTNGEPITTTGLDGVFSLSVNAGTVNLYATAPATHIATTSNVVSVNIPNSGTAFGVEFGFGFVNGFKTGTAFDDFDGDGFHDIGEPVLEGVYIYVDTDHDNSPDLGELNARSKDDGSYVLNLQIAGNYIARAVAPLGYQVSYPIGGEHNISYDGSIAANEYNFGFRSTLDFGDAPDTYGTTLDSDGARHGIVENLRIGSVQPDREDDGIPGSSATGDDNNAVPNDEVGVVQKSPLAPNATAEFEVTVTNTYGQTAYLQGFIDLNKNGVFTDAGEQFLHNRTINTGQTNTTHMVDVYVPYDAATGTTYMRWRLSTDRVGPTGFASTGEVQDHQVGIATSSELANDDYFEIPRNSVSVLLDVLENDFQLAGNPLVIDSLNTVGTKGLVASPTVNQIFYTPPNGFIGMDSFSYTVVDTFGNQATASVIIDVKFQSNVPIAIDDIYSVPENSVNRPLAVLNNDVTSINGGIGIASVSAGTEGGIISVIAGGQSISYTPQAGFAGTEQFVYTIQDGVGLVSTATVTVNMMPGSLNDDLAEYSIEIVDAVNGDVIDHVQVGDEFTVRVSVDDLRPGVPNGVASAFLDLLYTSALVSTVDSNPNDQFNFDIDFGPLFSGGSFQLGDASVPGLLNEVGSTQDVNNLTEHSGKTKLFDVTMRANAAGIAQFMGDPANTAPAETVLILEDDALLVEQLRFGQTELTILPTSDYLTVAVDDSFPDGLDSDGNVIINSSPARSRLFVLQNDNLGVTGTITEFGLVNQPTKGIAIIEDNGTPSNFADDYVSYRPNFAETGLEEFSYFVVTSEGVMTSADVTIALGSQNNDARVAFDFSLVDRAGDPVNPSEVMVGDEIGLRVTADDLKLFGDGGTLVYAGFLDVLYDAGILSPVDPLSGNYNFDLEFGSQFSEASGSGTAAVPGIIDEIGSLRSNTSFSFPYTSDDPATLVTIYFDVNAAGTARFAGSPADLMPQHDTLVFTDNSPVSSELIRLDVLTITVSTPGSGEQNQDNNYDVNGDGFVSPIDALIVINDLAMSGEGENSNNGSGNKNYPDVNGDFKVTAIDALLVVNRLGQNNHNASGEQLVPNLEDEDRFVSGSTDAVFADLGTGDLSSTEKIAITDCPKAPEVLVPSTAGADSDSRDDDDDEVLNLLAGDVDGIWG